MVPFNDRVHFFGDGCYDATVGANGKVFLLQDHLDRFYTSAKLLDIRIMPQMYITKFMVLAASMPSLAWTLRKTSLQEHLRQVLTKASMGMALADNIK